MSPDKKREPVRTDEQPLTLDDMQRLSPRGFEEFVKRMFEALGYAVEITVQTGDEGVDLVLARDGERSIAQCKRYRGQVGQPTVRDFYGTVVHEKAKRGYLVTSGRFSLPAQAWAEGKNVTLVDGPDLLEAARTLQTSLEGLEVSDDGSQASDDRCRVCSGELVPAAIGIGSASGVGKPKTNAIQCKDCKAVYELKTKSTLTRRERASHFYSCDDEGLEHNLRVTAIEYSGTNIKALVCRKGKAVFDFNGNRERALTETYQSAWLAKRRLFAMKAENKGKHDDMRRLMDWVQKGRELEEQPQRWRMPWSRQEDETARISLLELRDNIPRWPEDGSKIVDWMRAVTRLRKPAASMEPLQANDSLIRSILDGLGIPLAPIQEGAVSGQELGVVVRDLEESQGRRASSTDTRLALYESALRALIELGDGFIVFGWEERKECFVQFAWDWGGWTGFYSEVGSRTVSEGRRLMLEARGFKPPDTSTVNYYQPVEDPESLALAEIVEAVFIDVFECPLSYTVEVVEVQGA